MERRRFIRQMGFMGACFAAGAGWSGERATDASTPRSNDSCLPGPLADHRRTGRALGTTVSMWVRHSSERAAQTALDAAFAELERVEQLMSIYRDHSQLSQLNREQFLHKPDPSLVEVLQVAQQMARHSQGAFDVSVQPLWALYDVASRAGTLPARREIDRCLGRVDWRQIEIDADVIRLHGPDTQITLNGIAQGYAADQVMATLRCHGIEHALIDTGELSGHGQNAAAAPWQVGVQHPRQQDAYAAITQLDCRCLATSGDYEAEFLDDFSAHHILDPRLGISPGELSSVSVLAESATMADALSTTLMVLGRESGMKLLRRFAGVDALLIDKQGRRQATTGFPIVNA